MFKDAFLASFQAYGDPEAVIVFIVDKGQNTFSQEAIIPELLAEGLKVRKYLFEELETLVEYDTTSGRIYAAEEEVALFYFLSLIHI